MSEKKEELKSPEGTVLTFTIPLSREKDCKTATFYLKEMQEDVYLYVKSLQDAGKSGDAIRAIVKQLSLPGSDSVEVLKDNFVALNAAAKPVMQLLDPLEAEVKKN
jgi:hypothetical protein